MNRLQSLLDGEVLLANNGGEDSEERKNLHHEIRELRGNVPPLCWKHDDCSTWTMSSCPWRIDCIKEKSREYRSIWDKR